MLIAQDLIDAIDGPGARDGALLDGGGAHGWRHDGMVLVVLRGRRGHHSSTGRARELTKLLACGDLFVIVTWGEHAPKVA